MRKTPILVSVTTHFLKFQVIELCFENVKELFEFISDRFECAMVATVCANQTVTACVRI